MRTITVLMLTALLTTGAMAAELDRDEAPIERVMVYQDRAQVDRSAKVSAPTGRSEVVFTGLPAPLISGSLRARTGDDAVEVIGLTQREEVHLEERRAEVRELLEEMRGIRTEIRRLQVEDGKLQVRLEQIRQLREFVRGAAALNQTSSDLDTGALERSLDQFRGDTDDILQRRSALLADLTDRWEEMGELQQRIADLQYASDRTTTTVTVTLEAAAGKTVPVTLSYGVWGVSWVPRYDIRYDDEQLSLAYLSEVRQSSGEDWSDVQLVFTTSRPDEMRPPPTNQPLYLQGYKEKEKTVQLGSVREEAEEEDERSRSDKSGAVVQDGLQVVQRGLAVDLAVQRAVSVPADGRPYRIAVLEQALDAQVDRYATPSLSPHVFLRAQTTNQTGMPLLPGQVDVFRSAGYVGTIWLDSLAPGEKWDLSLGPAGPVTVTREFDTMRNRTVERAAGRKKVHFVYDVVAHNYGDSATDLVIAEAIPVSHVEQVKIKLGKETTQGFETTEDKSLHAWKLKLEAGEKKEIHVEYVVDLPEDYAWEGF